MSQLRTNPGLNPQTINELVIAPPKIYTYFQDFNDNFFQANVTDYSAINAWWMSEFSTLIYESKDKVEEEISKITNFEPIWLNGDDTNTQGLVVEFDEFIVIAFRGTELFRVSEISDFEKVNNFVQDFITDISGLDGNDLRGVSVHGGINDALNSVWEELSNLLEEASKPIWFTGHSLGGALALLAAFKWEVNPERIGGVYTIGCPAIGGSDFKEKYDAELYEKTFHHIYGEDIVTNIGQFIRNLPGIINFEQVGQKFYLPRTDVNLVENIIYRLLMPFIDHGPIFYMNYLWNQMIEQT